MPVFLQEKSCFCLLGQCFTSLNSNGESLNVSAEDENEVRSSRLVKKKQHSFREHSEENVCGYELDGFDQQCGKNDGVGDYWIHLIHKYSDKSDKGSRIPQLHHIHWKGQEVVQCNVHVILYDIPVHSEQHFTIIHWTSSKQTDATSKKLKWVDELQKGQAVFDMDATILAMNSASAAGKALERHIGSDRSYPIKSMCLVSVSIGFFLGNTFHYNVFDSSSVPQVLYAWTGKMDMHKACKAFSYYMEKYRDPLQSDNLLADFPGG